MILIDAIESVLRQAGIPLHSRDIARQVRERGVWKSAGKTPDKTVAARLAVDIKVNGQASRFVRAGPGVYALRDAAAPISSIAAPGTGATLTFLDAAERVLDEIGAGAAMHYREIVEKALELGLISTTGRTPAATLNAQVLVENERRRRRGQTPRFVRHGRGLIGLTRWMPMGLTSQIEEHNRIVRQKLQERLLALTAPEFESLVARLLTALGFSNVVVEGRSGDGGVDVRGTLVVGDVIQTNMAVQAKKWKANVQAPVVTSLRGSLGVHDQGLIITTSGFSAGAREEAASPNKTPVGLIDGRQLVDLLVEHGIGVRREHRHILELRDLEDQDGEEEPRT